MSHTTSEEQKNTMTVSRLLTGRRQIFTNEKKITAENVTKVLEDAYTKHLTNRNEIQYLYDYYVGKQAVQGRTKVNHEEITSKITENICAEIKDFWNGYLCGEPIQYVSADGEESDEVAKLNRICNAAGKPTIDKEIVGWAMICGTAYRIITPNPLEMYCLDPRNAFVIYENSYTKKPIAGVVYDTADMTIEGVLKSRPHFYVYTETDFFDVYEGTVVQGKNGVGIAVVEYPANETRQGCFERVLPLADAINELQSNRLDGVAQQIQSILAIFNADLPEGTSSTDIRDMGLIQLISKDGNKGDIKEIATHLDQNAVQTLKKDLYEAALRISGVPSTGNGNTGDSSNNGAVILKNGWQGAEARAKDYELMFKHSERKSIELLRKILRSNGVLDFDAEMVDAHFTRRQYEAINAKTQVLVQLLSCGKVAPRLAFAVSGLFTDPESAYKESEEWYKANAASVQTDNTAETDSKEDNALSV